VKVLELWLCKILWISDQVRAVGQWWRSCWTVVKKCECCWTFRGFMFGRFEPFCDNYYDDGCILCEIQFI